MDGLLDGDGADLHAGEGGLPVFDGQGDGFGGLAGLDLVGDILRKAGGVLELGAGALFVAWLSAWAWAWAAE